MDGQKNDRAPAGRRDLFGTRRDAETCVASLRGLKEGIVPVTSLMQVDARTSRPLSPAAMGGNAAVFFGQGVFGSIFYWPSPGCGAPVDTLVLYPSLLELCGLSGDSRCDGVSIVPLLRDPDGDWTRPAVMTYGRGNHAVRSERWRYIRYADGIEELYDHRSDPHEWTNLAEGTDHEVILRKHRGWLPEREAEPVENLKRRKR